MQKLNKKRENHTSHFALHASQKGITLIALIITIIVMLILVGVTINVALNGGLFETAETAAIGTEKQAIYEQIVSNMELTDNGKISVKGTFDKVVAEFGVDKVINITPATVDSNTKEVTFSIIGKAGTYNYKITGNTIEKDSVTTPEPPSESGRLQLLKIYRDQDISVVFFENQVFIADRIGNVFPYVYNEEEKTIIIDSPVGTITGTLSEDGKNITAYIIDKDYSFSIVQGAPEYLSKHGVYEGIYYNADEQKYACITKDYNYDEFGNVSILFENEEWTIRRASGITSYVEIPDEGEGKIIKFANPILNPDGEKHYSGTLIEYTLLGTE